MGGQQKVNSHLKKSKSGENLKMFRGLYFEILF